MKASELIAELQKQIGKYGDLPVYRDADGEEYEISNVDPRPQIGTFPERFEAW